MKLVAKNWAEFQHYHNRMPPWIKLHKSLLDNFEFMSLPTASKALAPLLWLLASESEDGQIDGTPAKIAFRLRMSVTEVTAGLTPLIHNGFFLEIGNASTPLAIGLQDACLETERETEGEAERELEKETEGEREKEYCLANVHDVFDYWKSKLNHTRSKLDPKRRKLIATRLKEGYTVADLRKAIIGCSVSQWHMGANDRGTKFDSLELILRDATNVDKFIGYADNPPKARGRAAHIQDAGRAAVDEFVNAGAAPDFIDAEVRYG
jgi:hypothetical protein